MIYRLDTPYISHIHITHISTHPLFRIDIHSASSAEVERTAP